MTFLWDKNVIFCRCFHVCSLSIPDTEINKIRLESKNISSLSPSPLLSLLQASFLPIPLQFFSKRPVGWRRGSKVLVECTTRLQQCLKLLNVLLENNVKFNLLFKTFLLRHPSLSISTIMCALLASSTWLVLRANPSGVVVEARGQQTFRRNDPSSYCSFPS